VSLPSPSRAQPRSPFLFPLFRFPVRRDVTAVLAHRRGLDTGAVAYSHTPVRSCARESVMHPRTHAHSRVCTRDHPGAGHPSRTIEVSVPSAVASRAPSHSRSLSRACPCDQAHAHAHAHTYTHAHASHSPALVSPAVSPGYPVSAAMPASS
jgi:hypothetical protein